MTKPKRNGEIQAPVWAAWLFYLVCWALGIYLLVFVAPDARGSEVPMWLAAGLWLIALPMSGDRGAALRDLLGILKR